MDIFFDLIGREREIFRQIRGYEQLAVKLRTGAALAGYVLQAGRV